MTVKSHLPRLAVVLALAGRPASADTVTVVDKPDVTQTNACYAGNRAPLLPSPLIKLPAGAIAPQGWLRRQLELEADGFTGHLTEISSFCRKSNNAWLSKEGVGANGWEEVPYWFRGFCALGYALGDERIIRESREWLEAVIASQREDGYFGPRTNLKEKGDHDLMPNMSMMFALRAFHEYTGDPRIVPLLTQYFRWQLQIPDKLFFAGGWQVPRNGDNMDSVYWLYNRTGEPWLLELADKLRRCGASWMKEPTGCHNVDYSMGFRKPAQFYPQNKDPAYLLQTEKNFDSIYGIYGQVPGGMFAGDEFARPGFTDPRNAIETCGIVDMMLSQEILLGITGDPKWADRCENAAYNTLPAAMTADMKGLRYLTSPNQIVSDRRNKAPELADQGDMQSMNPHSHRCCQHNAGMGWPLFAENLWMATPGNGLAAVFYSACTVKARVGTGGQVTIVEKTPYPFDGRVEFVFDCAGTAAFPLYLRIPGWCAAPRLRLNGQPLAVEGRPLSYLRIDRTWAAGDTLELTLPMEVVVTRWAKNRNSASVGRGPLSFSVKIGEEYVRCGGTDAWPAREILPTTPWNYGLALDPRNPAAGFEVVARPWPASNEVFTHDGTPVELRAQVKRIPNWTDTGMGLPGKLQPSPVKSAEPVETITLIPMGAARLRISAFPVIGEGPDAREWTPTEPMPASYWPKPGAPDLLRDGRLPSAGARDVDCFKWIGWAMYNAGTKNWVRQDFDREEMVGCCEVYWAAGGGGSLTDPADWKLQYLDGSDWKDVELEGGYGFATNAFTRVKFKPVRTRALKIEAQTRPKRSSGIFEWRSWLDDGAVKRHAVTQSFGVDIMGDPAVKTVTGCDVTWHAAAADATVAPPQAWKLLYRQGERWVEVPNPSGYGRDPAKPNTVTFDPVQTSALRIEVQCAPAIFAGPSEWKIR